MINADLARVRRYSNPSCNSAIVPKISSIHQYFLLVKDNRLTEVIEALEKRGFTGDLAIFILACLQRGVV
ncbi:hypothetical protein LC608_34710 [Nostoc sp. XA010]|uniref:hypothetical protein n=1 Tax=Nostoc sp. XA010 TaxID=2780407 RepID=UPI001E492319|nr:hypothetical protein [Nostoc sp. XA010]MCC5661998.1 hypothetical protein [Nostoc sp. XA010]